MLYLNLPDASDVLKLNPKYAIQFANENIWNETLGANLLFNNVTINISNETPEIEEPEVEEPETQIIAVQNITSNGNQLTINVSYGAITGHQLYISTDNSAEFILSQEVTCSISVIASLIDTTKFNDTFTLTNTPPSNKSCY